MNYFEDYLDYFLVNISGESKYYSLYEQQINIYKEKGKTEETLRGIQLIHNRLFHSGKIKFLDYHNYKRCVELGLPLK